MVAVNRVTVLWLPTLTQGVRLYASTVSEFSSGARGTSNSSLSDHPPICSFRSATPTLGVLNVQMCLLVASLFSYNWFHNANVHPSFAVRRTRGIGKGFQGISKGFQGIEQRQFGCRLPATSQRPTTTAQWSGDRITAME